jgi:isopenicillin N synthase-like dioxygenase
MLPTAKKLSFDNIPVIDLGPLQDGSDASRAKVAKDVVEACARVGFMYIKNHGIPQQALDDIFQTSIDFHNLPLDAKMDVSIMKNGDSQGYLPGKLKGEAGGALHANSQEAFQFHRQLAAGDPDLNKPMRSNVAWPPAMPDLEPRMMDYWNQVNPLAYTLLDLFELGLALEPGALRKFHEKDMNMLRVLHYPPQEPDSQGLGARAHTDTNTLTVLLQDAIGGLEIQNGQEEWVAVPPMAGTLVVNVGEVLKVWTDGILSSTRHRVINRTGRERYSVPFFLLPSFDAVIQPLMKNPDPSNVAPENLHTSMPRDKAFVYGDFKLGSRAKTTPGVKAIADY